MGDGRVPPRVRSQRLAQRPPEPRVRLDRGHRPSLAQAPHEQVVKRGLADAGGGDGQSQGDARPRVVADGPRRRGRRIRRRRRRRRGCVGGEAPGGAGPR